MPHIKNLIDTDCYIEFDNATELRLFAQRNEIILGWLVMNDDKFIRLYSDGRDATPVSRTTREELPIYHYNNITEWVKPPYEKLEDDYYQDYIDSNL